MLKKKRNTKKLISFVFVLFVLFSLISGIGVGGNAYADTDLSGYTNVMDDLQKDEEFNAAEYPDNKEDYDKSIYAEIANFYSLHVIQIAESTAGGLFVYVYQPAANITPLTATSINMALTDKIGGVLDENTELTDEDSADVYNLIFLNRNSVFAKYKVTNFSVTNGSVRYYNITSIYRVWVEGLDDPTGNDNVIDEVSFRVGKLFTAKTVNGNVSYTCEQKDIVTITDKYVDFLRYKNGVSGVVWARKDYTDSHYVAFSTDWDISNLYDVDVSFIIQPMKAEKSGNLSFPFEAGASSKVTIKVDKEMTGENTPSGWFKSKYYSWERIQSVEAFKADPNNKLEADTKNNLNGKQWVLRFYETDYFVEEHDMYGSLSTTSYTSVKELTILRLHFKSNGVVYNLGVLDNKQSADDKPGNIPDKKTLWDYFIEFCKWLESLTGVSYIIWAIIILAVPLLIAYSILSIFFPPLRKLFTGIWWLIKKFAYGFGWLVSRPFVWIKNR
ncbi:MAG: hypothetical protein K2K38_04935 [Clostridia bacterium]|nr:hypothetical protein [Clostridia bacterium]